MVVRLITVIALLSILATQAMAQQTLRAEPDRLSLHENETLTVTVQAGSPNDDTGEPRDAFIELATDKDQVYVQEQLVLTVKLFFTGNLIRGDLTEPEHPDAIIESLGKQKEYSRFRDGQRYRVVERRYAIYPQSPGALALDPIRFEGQTRSTRGQLVFLRDNAQLFDIPVNAPPDQFSGDVWLPARELNLNERGLDNISEVNIGQSMTRTIALTADGLPANALPPLTPAIPEGLRSYPEQPETETVTSEQTVTGSLTQTTALVGVKAGTFTLPEVRVPWWDTEADQERVAVIPARTLTVLPEAGSQAAAPPPTRAEPVETEATTPPQNISEEAQSNYWPWVTALLAAGWIITLLLWRRQGKPAVSHKDGPQRAFAKAEKDLFEALVHAADNGRADTLDLLPRWMAARYPGEFFSSTSDALHKADDPELKAQINRLESRLFGPGQHPDKASAWDGGKLVTRLHQLRKEKVAKDESDGELPPFYPDGLNPGVR